MLNVFSSRTQTNCDGSTRRDFLKVGALGLGALTLPDLLRARAQASAHGQPTRNTSVVWLWLGGGPTHVETFDPKMSAPAEFRGANNPSTGLPNYVRMSSILGDGPSWLGSAYAPFDTAGNARNNMELRITMDRLAERRTLLRSFDSIDREIDRTGVMNGLDSFD